MTRCHRRETIPPPGVRAGIVGAPFPRTPGKKSQRCLWPGPLATKPAPEAVQSAEQARHDATVKRPGLSAGGGHRASAEPGRRESRNGGVSGDTEWHDWPAPDTQPVPLIRSKSRNGCRRSPDHRHRHFPSNEFLRDEISRDVSQREALLLGRIRLVASGSEGWRCAAGARQMPLEKI